MRISFLQLLVHRFALFYNLNIYKNNLLIFNFIHLYYFSLSLKKNKRKRNYMILNKRYQCKYTIFDTETS